MKIQYKYKMSFVVLLVSLLLTGCDFLDNEPKGLTIPKECEHYKRLLASQGFMRSFNDDLLFFNDDIKLLDNTSESNYSYIFINKQEYERNIYTFKHGQVLVPGSSDYTWDGSYSSIFTLNTIINNVLSSKGDKEKEKQVVYAEALFHRAWEYFCLINIYAKHYNKETASEDIGIPYITVGDINASYEQLSVQAVYDNILKDLDEAGKYLSEIVPNKAHPSQTALKSMYALVYLYMADYDKALEYSTAALEDNNTLLNLNDYEVSDGTTWGRVHLKGEKDERFPDIDHPEAILIKFFNGGPQCQFLLSEDMREVFKQDLAEDELDLRKEYYFAEDSVVFNRVSYFEGECAYVFYSNMNSGLTTVGNYLIAAECYARKGQLDEAMALINTIRKNRHNAEKVTELTASTKKEALAIVLRERRREYVMNAGYRLFDLKRLHVDSEYPEYHKTVVHEVDGERYELPPGDLRYVYPINALIKEFNPNIKFYDR